MADVLPRRKGKCNIVLCVTFEIHDLVVSILKRPERPLLVTLTISQVSPDRMHKRGIKGRVSVFITEVLPQNRWPGCTKTGPTHRNAKTHPNSTFGSHIYLHHEKTPKWGTQKGRDPTDRPGNGHHSRTQRCQEAAPQGRVFASKLSGFINVVDLDRAVATKRKSYS
jgi:hypothetical protein